jgi:flagellar hook-length control protein FliK
VNNESSPVSKTMHDAQAAKTSDHEQRYGGEPVQNNTVNNESSPVSKMIHDAQLVKDNHTRMDAAMNDEPGGKVTKVDAGNNDNGLLSSQNQTADKAFEATSPSRQTDAGQDSLRTQTLDQIVRKAVIYMRNGQHEAKIDLKPEFLGHVRLQVTTENHQVTVRVLTEFGFVKDMVENNIHQLKADLQQQGLNVDKLEVAVSNDSDENKHPQEKTGLAKDRQRSVARTNPENREEETREQAGNSGLKKAGTTTVDYFA